MSILTISCDDYLDVNEDIDNPTIAPNGQLLSNIQVTTATIGDFRLWSGNILQVYTHQLTAREDEDQYNVKPDDLRPRNDWDNIYTLLTDIESLASQSIASGEGFYLGISKLYKAYLMSTAVDLWGDVPFSEATQLEAGIISPSFDKQQDIYMEVLKIIDEAKTDITSDENTSIDDADLIYGGDKNKWLRFANSFQLKLYNQIRLSELFNTPEVQDGFRSLLAEDNFYTDNGDDFEFKHTGAISPRDERNNLWRDSYNAGQFTTYASPWFYEILIGTNPTIHTSNPDPRLPYYFLSQLKDGEFPRDQGDEDTMNPNADYWDKATGFISIRFGSVGPARDAAIDGDATYPGIFPCGGLYDDNTGLSAKTNGQGNGTAIAPRRMFTYDEFLYVQAELMQVGLMIGDPGTQLEKAIMASMSKVDKVVSESQTSQNVPVLSGSTGVTDFITKIMEEFNSGDNEKKLEVIMTQKWVATFADPIDQYNDLRRTGYPVIANPLSSTQEYQLDNGDGFPLRDSDTTLNGSFQLSFFWPQSELNSNRNSPTVQKNATEYKIFWDN
ncbi:SusD/RagB family nutrient-binding outer membrane lipoprotein [Aquimarina agarilytica]|uniref:SusD/RagB family nutrient-binding outer membrane lipoprotein n=1 Tax=Aquimarina agarilytica TaxID=1087449 RepID=UPI0002FA85B4|nr:SusD/RagB family nutrient-binding outer membrane lipoprotein [Aquimarina agarilytica]